MKPSGGSTGFLPSVIRAFVGTAPSEPNQELCKVLDEDFDTSNGATQHGDAEAATREGMWRWVLMMFERNRYQYLVAAHAHTEEHLLRIRAEAAAQDAERRLVVAQEQLAEYAAQKRLDTDGLLQRAAELEQVSTVLLLLLLLW